MQRLSLKALSTQVYIFYFYFLKLFFFICGFHKNQWRNSQKKTVFKSGKSRSFIYLVLLRFKWHRCASKKFLHHSFVISNKLFVISNKLFVISNKMLVISNKMFVVSNKIFVISNEMFVTLKFRWHRVQVVT